MRRCRRRKFEKEFAAWLRRLNNFYCSVAAAELVRCGAGMVLQFFVLMDLCETLSAQYAPAVNHQRRTNEKSTNHKTRWNASVQLFLRWTIVGRPARHAIQGSGRIDAVKQVAQDMGDAMVANDIDRLNGIFADDWATLGSQGKLITKQNLLSDFKSFHGKLLWFENGPIDVKVFGDVAVSQGSVKEKRTRNGKDTSGQFLWMDLLKKRDGKWVVVRSDGARVTSGDSAQTQSEDPTIVET